MALERVEISLVSKEDVVAVRQTTRKLAVELGFTIIDQTKLITAASELARNTVIHGGGGTATIQVIREGMKQGLRLTFEDHGPGIPNVEVAMTDGYTSGSGLGLGLGGSRRLCSEFSIESQLGAGTRVTIARWIS